VPARGTKILSLKHRVDLSKQFIKDSRKLNGKLRQILESRLKDIGNNPYAGKRLKGPLRDKYSIRLDKRHRIIYSIPEYCVVLIGRVLHRKIAYQ